MAETTIAPDSSGNWFSNLWGGLTGAVTGVANSSAAQKLLDVGAGYAEQKLAIDAAEKQAEAAWALKASNQTTLPGWVIPVGVGSAILLVLALILKGRGK